MTGDLKVDLKRDLISFGVGLLVRETKTFGDINWDFGKNNEHFPQFYGLND